MKNAEVRKVLILNKFVPSARMTLTHAKVAWYLGFSEQYSFSRTNVTAGFYLWTFEARLKLGGPLTELESLYHVAMLEIRCQNRDQPPTSLERSSLPNGGCTDNRIAARTSTS